MTNNTNTTNAKFFNAFASAVNTGANSMNSAMKSITKEEVAKACVVTGEVVLGASVASLAVGVVTVKTAAIISVAGVLACGVGIGLAFSGSAARKQALKDLSDFISKTRAAK